MVQPKHYEYECHDQLGQHVDNVVCADKFGQRLKTHKGLTPHVYICKV